MLEENKEMEAMDYEAILDKKTDELTELLDKRDMKALQKRMEELNEFDVAEFSGLLLEYGNEFFSYYLALLLGFGHALQFR